MCWHCRFDRFKVYVSGREESLKRTFESLDLDHDGRLTASEVEAGLSNFAFTCPFSRCVYRTKQQVPGVLLPCDLPAALRSCVGQTSAPCCQVTGHRDIGDIASSSRQESLVKSGMHASLLELL